MCKSKIHRATVTQVNPDYTGSITIDKKLLREAEIYPFEKVQIASFTTGVRFETYTIEGEENSGIIGVNGAAARLCNVGDEILIISYAIMDDPQANLSRPKVLHVNKQNQIIRIEALEITRI